MRHPKYDPTSKAQKEGMKKLMDGFGLNSAESLPVTDNSKVNLNMIKQIEDLKTKLAESEAETKRVKGLLEQVLDYATELRQQQTKGE
tara:strand:- start:5837 stop:6100 length:264 start_codon:yes stop_codon:yes gene_type:complete